MVRLSSPGLLISAILFLSVTVGAEVAEDRRKQVYDLCRKEANVPESANISINNYLSSDALKDHKCFVKCIFQNFGLMTPEGTMDMDKTIATMKRYWKTEETEKKLTPVLKDCDAKVKKESDVCEYTFKFWDCYLDGRKKVM